jgi:hypothetical protein
MVLVLLLMPMPVMMIITQLGTDDSGSPRSPVLRIRTIMRTVAMSMAM